MDTPKAWSRNEVKGWAQPTHHPSEVSGEGRPGASAEVARPVSGGYASAGLLAWVCVSKYLDHLPLYRQEQMFGRWGAAIPCASLCEWIRIAAEWFEPVYALMHRRLLEGDYLQADETPVKCHDPDAGKGAVSQGYLWLISQPAGTWSSTGDCHVGTAN